MSTSKVGILMSKANMRGKNEYTVTKTLNTKAFTFVEVIVALAVVSISLLALLRLHIISITMADAAETTSQAVFLAEGKIAEALALGYPGVSANSGSVEKNNLRFYWQTEVADLGLKQADETDITGLRKISVDVSWKKGVGRKQLQISTYVADKKLK